MLPSDRNLKDYLPGFLTPYLECLMNAEEPEFELAWGKLADFLDDAFILSAHDSGAARFERILKITPSSEDTLESRISRILIRWENTFSYTWKHFQQKIQMLCGDDYELTENWSEYQLCITTHLDLYGQVEDLERVFRHVLPANIQVIAENILDYLVEGRAYVAAGQVFIGMFQLTDSFGAVWSLGGVACPAAAGSGTCEIMLTDSFNDVFAINSEAGGSAAHCITDQIEVSDSYQDTVYGFSNANTGAGITYTICI
jgi:hypothetical protein